MCGCALMDKGKYDDRDRFKRKKYSQISLEFKQYFQPMCGCALLDKDKYDDKHSDSVSLCPDSWYFITTDIVIATSYMLKSVIRKGIIEGAIKKFWECGRRRGWALLETFVRLLLILFANKTHCSGMGGGSPTLRALATISYFIISSHSLLSPNACLSQVWSLFDLPRSGKELCSR